MSEALPARPHLDWYRKSAKKKLKSLRAKDPRAKLADAQLAVAREHGCKSWRELKAQIDAARIDAVNLPQVFRDLMKAIVGRDIATVRSLIAQAPAVVNRTGPHPMWGGRPQPLHVAIETGNDDAFALLIESGADLNGNNAEYDLWSPLMLASHWNRAAMCGELLRRGASVGLIEALMLGEDDRVVKILREHPEALKQPFPNDATPLHFARTARAAKKLLETGANIDAKDKYGATPLQRLAGKGKAFAPLVRLLISRGAAVDARTVASAGDLKRLKQLGAANPQTVGRDPEALHAAIEGGHLAVVRWLLDHRADINARTSRGSKATPLHAAAWNGNLKMVKLLVSRGADVAAVDEEHRTTPAVWARTALERVNRLSCRAVAEYLESTQGNRPMPKIETPSDKPKRKNDWKPIMDAAFLGDVDRARKLLDAGADPNAQGTTGHHYRPLHRAIEHKKTMPKHAGHDAVVNLLLERGADPKLRATFENVNALLLAAMQEPRFVAILKLYFEPLNLFDAAVVGDEKRVAQLLKQERKLATAVDESGQTALHFAAASAMFKLSDAAEVAQVNVVKLLLDAGASPMATYKFGGEWPIPVLYGCCGRHDNPAVARVLFEAGATPYDGESVYHAADEDHRECLAPIEEFTDMKKLAKECTGALPNQLHWARTRGMKWLLAHGADPNFVSPLYGDNALHAAIKRELRDEVISTLLSHGADPKIKNKEGRSAIALAKASGKMSLLNQLQGAGLVRGQKAKKGASRR